MVAAFTLFEHGAAELAGAAERRALA